MLHEQRVARRRAWVVIEAVSSALTGRVGRAWFEALADTAEQASIQHQTHVAARNEAEMSSRQGVA